MKNLIKYEAKKSLFSKLVLLVIVAIFETFYLYGLCLTNYKENAAMSIGIIGLIVCTAVGVIFAGIQSMFTLYRDLNTKQSYMLFMTPNSSYKILGAKVIENALSIVTTALFFTLLGTLDFSLLVARVGGIQKAITLLNTVSSFDIELNEVWRDIILIFLSVVASWIMTTMIGYLAITLSSSIFAGKKLNGFASFGLFIVLTIALDKIVFQIPDLFGASTHIYRNISISVAASFIVSAILYIITSNIMEKKLSV